MSEKDLREKIHSQVSNFCGHEATSDAGFSVLNGTPVCAVCLDIADSILSLLREEGVDLEGWRPIEEAPKDGERYVLLFDAEPEFEPIAEICFWHDEGPVTGWCLDGEGGNFFRPQHCYTHWRPLPAPPLSALETHNG